MSFVIPSIFTAVDRLTAPMRNMQRAVTSFGNATVTAGAKSERAFRKLGNGADRAFNALNPFSKLSSAAGFLGISVGVAGATSLIKKFVTEAATVEDATASFTALLGGVENAKKVVDDLYKLGAATPFEFSDLSSAANMMIGFGAATQTNVIDKLQMIGDIAQGNAEKLGGITLAFSQIEAAGKASMQDVNQLINNGVPILGQLAKQWNMTTGAAREAVSKGKASSKEITKAFEAMTGKGGMFYNGMAIASQTFTGKVSTLKDTINQSFAAIGSVALPIVKEYIDKTIGAAEGVQKWVQNNQGLIKVKVAEWVEKISNVLKFLYNNFDTIVTIAKVYLGTLIALKVASMAFAIATGIMQAATIAYNVVLGISTALQGKSAFFVMGNTVAYGAYRAVVVASTAAQWLLNAALAANPIGATVMALVALIALVAAAIKYYDTWGATLLWFLGPIGWVISAFKSIYDNWELIKKGFTTGGIIGGLKALGATLLDVVLLPLKQILTLMSNLPGAVGRAANSAANSIEGLRDKLGTGINARNIAASVGSVPVSSSFLSNFGEGIAPAVNPKQDMKTMYQSITQTNKQSAEITIKDDSGKASVSKNTGGIPIKLTPTLAQFGG